MKKILLASLFLIMPFFAHAEPFDMHAKNFGMLDYDALSRVLDKTMPVDQCGEAKDYILTGLISGVGDAAFSGEDLVKMCAKILGEDALELTAHSCQLHCGKFGFEYVKALANRSLVFMLVPGSLPPSCSVVNKYVHEIGGRAYADVGIYTIDDCLKYADISAAGTAVKDYCDNVRVAYNSCLTELQRQYAVKIEDSRTSKSDKKVYNCVADKIKRGLFNYPVDTAELEASCK